MKKVTVIIIGAGDRGKVYADYAKHFPNKMKVVGVAEPRDFQRNQIVKEHSIKEENIFHDWKEVVQKEKFADAVIIATQDKMHLEPTEKFADLGYEILLEKPMATNLEDCRKIVNAIKRNNSIFGVCHVLRYTHYTQELKKILNSGKIGEIVSVQHLEPVGYWHQAHSFVRGNWKNKDESTFMLLAKSCHDIDWLYYIIGEKCRKVSSFGSLKHFKKENKPKNAADRCLDCKVEKNCVYSAKNIYFSFLEKGIKGWPLNVLTSDISEKGTSKALREGDYGRCVYSSDNNVVDHQVVNFEFEKEITATFTMTAFNKAASRKTRIFGTKGEIYGDGKNIEIFDFLTDKTEVVDTSKLNEKVMQGHGGGDFGIMKNFVEAVSKNDQSLIITGVQESLESHIIDFAAEKSRLEEKLIHFINGDFNEEN